MPWERVGSGGCSPVGCPLPAWQPRKDLDHPNICRLLLGSDRGWASRWLESYWKYREIREGPRIILHRVPKHIPGWWSSFPLEKHFGVPLIIGIPTSLAISFYVYLYAYIHPHVSPIFWVVITQKSSRLEVYQKGRFMYFVMELCEGKVACRHGCRTWGQCPDIRMMCRHVETIFNN